MLPILITLGPLAAANAALLVASATPVSGTPLTLTGVQPDTARRILLTYGNEASARTMVLTGTNSSGMAIQETLVIPSGAPGLVASTQDYATLASALPAGGGWTAAMTLGTNTVASTPWKVTDSSRRIMTQLTWDGHILAGAGTWGIEYTLDDPNSNSGNQPAGVLGNFPTPPLARPYTLLTAQAADAQGSYDNPLMAWRAVITGVTPFAVQIHAFEGGVR